LIRMPKEGKAQRRTGCRPGARRWRLLKIRRKIHGLQPGGVVKTHLGRFHKSKNALEKLGKEPRKRKRISLQQKREGVLEDALGRKEERRGKRWEEYN